MSVQHGIKETSFDNMQFSHNVSTEPNTELNVVMNLMWSRKNPEQNV